MGGLPGSPPQDFIPHLFWSCVITTGHVWRRLIRPYRMPPLCLARLVDVNTSAAGKRQLADWVMNLPECCQCEEFLKPLRTIVHSSHDLLSAEGYECLVAAFQTKNVNIEVENNFARANAMQTANNGHTTKSETLFAKHVLAEMKTVHRTCIKHQDHSQEPVVFDNPPVANGLADGIESSLVKPYYHES